MADDQKPEPPRPVRLIRSKEFRVAYANTFRFRTTVNDVGIAFGYNTELPSELIGGLPQAQQTLIQDEVEVVVTPSVLKVLHMAMTDNIEALEVELGAPIPVPQEVVDALAEAKAKLLAEKTQKKASTEAG